jgi:FtsP/CotA-like multicopper oxidase with cupredoxin domain
MGFAIALWASQTRAEGPIIIPVASDGELIQAPIIESRNGVLNAKMELVRAGAPGSQDSILYGNRPLFSSPIPPTPGSLPGFPIPQFPLCYVAAYQITTSDGRVLPAQFPGPTLKIKPGEVLNLETKNELAVPNSAPQPPAAQMVTNFHTHGVVVNPLASQDNIFRLMGSEGTYKTSITVPLAQRQGVSWYHTHAHGNTADQVYGGLAGALQIGDPLDPWPQYLGKYDEKIMHLTLNLKTLDAKTQGYFLDDPTCGAPCDPANPHYGEPGYWSVTVNGQFNPSMHMRPGETQIWTFVASVRNGAFNLGITDENGANPWKSTIMAYDGNGFDTLPLQYVQKLPTNYVKNGPMAIDPGARITVAVTAPKTPGSYYLIDNLWQKMTPTKPFSLMKIVVGGDPATEPPPILGPTGTVPDLYNPDITIDKRRSFTFSRDFDGPDPTTGQGTGWIQFKINDAMFPNGQMVTMQVGQVEEWVLTNTSPIDHPFHIHQNDIAVMSVNGKPVNATGTQPGPDDSPGGAGYSYVSLRDTVVIPAGGSTVIRFRVSPHQGKYVFHCHILTHEDLGMMASVLVDANAEQRKFALGGQGNRVNVIDGRGASLGFLSPLPSTWHGGVAAASGNLDDDGYQDIVAGPAKGGSRGRVTVYNGKDLSEIRQFIPFPEFGSSGVNLAIGDIDHDGLGEIIASRVAPGKSLVRIFRADGSLFKEISGLLPGRYPHGINVASADFNGDNYDDIVLGAGKGREPLVIGLNGYSLGLPGAGTEQKLFEFVAPGGKQAGVRLAGSYLAPYTMPAFMANLMTTPASGREAGKVTVWNTAGHSHSAMSAMAGMSDSVTQTNPSPVATMLPFGNRRAPLWLATGRLGEQGQSVLASWVSANQPVYQALNPDGSVAKVTPPTPPVVAKASPKGNKPSRAQIVAHVITGKQPIADRLFLSGP